ncbi:hypothetical protein BG006_004653, partial [Podila minutissima]
PMSSADHKRKASSPEATTTTIESSTLGSSDHQPKKPRTEDTTTTTKNTIDHAPDCDDPSCPGCGEGELELQFDGKPSALELFSLAREEASKESLSTHGTGAAKKLFDLAIEAFEELEKSNAHLEMGDDPASEVAKTLLETKIQHAACVVAVGNYMPSLAMDQDGVAKYQKLFREHAMMAGENSAALIGQGIAELSAVNLARQLFEQAFQHIEKARAAKPELFEQNADIQSLYGSCLFNKARM